MKVYSGKRAFTRESTTRGEASVVVQNVVGDEPAGRGLTSESNPSTGSRHRLGDRRPLTHVSHHSPDGFEWGRDEWQLPGDEIEPWLQTPDIWARLAELAQEQEDLAKIRRLEEEAERVDGGAAD